LSALRIAATACGFAAVLIHGVAAQSPSPAPAAGASGRAAGSAPSGPTSGAVGPVTPRPTGGFVAPEYVIGADDVLNVRVWEEDRIAGDVRVRPDGKITLPLVGELVAAGLTPTEFKLALTNAAQKFVQSPTVDVIVKDTASKRVYITGEVRRPETYPLSGRMTISQLIARAGGFTEYANKGKITIFRIDTEGNTSVIKINYDDLINGKNLKQNNVELVNGDVINVPD